MTKNNMALKWYSWLCKLGGLLVLCLAITLMITECHIFHWIYKNGNNILRIFFKHVHRATMDQIALTHALGFVTMETVIHALVFATADATTTLVHFVLIVSTDYREPLFHLLYCKSKYIIGFWIHNLRMNIFLRNKVETYQTFRQCHMDFFDGRETWWHGRNV